MSLSLILYFSYIKLTQTNTITEKKLTLYPTNTFAPLPSQHTILMNVALQTIIFINTMYTLRKYFSYFSNSNMNLFILTSLSKIDLHTHDLTSNNNCTQTNQLVYIKTAQLNPIASALIKYSKRYQLLSHKQSLVLVMTYVFSKHVNG